MKSLIILVICALALVECQQRRGGGRTAEERGHFKTWKDSFQKKYRSRDEEEDALEKMLENKAKIDAHNKLAAQGKVTYRRALWKYSDLDNDEKKKFLGGLSPPPELRSLPASPEIPQFPKGPLSVDWRKQNLVGPVMDQG